MTTETPATPAADATPAVPADPAAIASRDAELTQLYEADPVRYEYEDGGRYANEHAAIRKAQQSKEAITNNGDEASAQDADELDILSDNDADDGETGDEDASESSVKALGPGLDATDEELANWRTEHGVPDAPEGYEPPTVEGIEWDQDALAPILQIAHAHNLPSKPVADALAEYAKRIQTQRAQIKQRDAENAKVVRSELSADEIAAVKSAAKAMPAELRTMLNSARLPDGTKLANQPEVLRLIAARYGAKASAAEQPQQRDSQQMEAARLDHLMRTDIDAYMHKPWELTGMTGSERALQIRRQLDDPDPNPAATATARKAEEAKLVALSRNDPQLFAYGSWPNARSPADRLHQLRTGRS